MNTRTSWIVFWIGALAYMVAVLQRATMGVAGVSAVERFDATAAAFSTLAVMQLVIYAGMQVPVGVLIDRLGPRVLIIFGLIFLTAGQVILALADQLGVAVLGRILVGAGDAAIFVSVLRLISSWFTGKWVPQLSQWIGNIGQLGQVLSALPFAWVLHRFGWSPAFLSAAALCVLALVLVLATVRDRPRDAPVPPPVGTWGQSVRELGLALRRPGTQLGFWSHFTTQSPGTVFSLLWGIPFMVYGLGYTEGFAAAMLLVVVFSGIAIGPVLGLLSARYPYRRSNIVLGLVFAIAIAWAAVLLWPGEPPLWLVIIMLVAMGAGGPGSLIGFDFARTYNPSRVLGSANGLVNVGGFSASFVIMFLMGVILDFVGGHGGPPSAVYSLHSFRFAMIIQFVVIAFGVIMLFRARRRTRSVLSEDGIEVGPVWVALVARLRKKDGRDDHDA
ncbi:MFS transporter [Mycetocola tolaasinivorans]|uniref:MFS transporter n=1 Tax=Mycetocola tolaasinivorans TaxID=76635 RepID=A0A3L7AA56_9MICO|nr:MFS transporter [Mycetocola tolaasinivorans]RLP76945.1 MFS transporter [Mycetocola tolaasinivorans]